MTLRIFFVRSLQENQRTLAILTLRIEESFPKEFELISDLNELHSIVNELTRDFVRTVEECERETPPSPPSNEPLVHVGVTRSNNNNNNNESLFDQKIKTHILCYNIN